MKQTPFPILCTGRVYCDLIFTGLPNMPVMGQEVFSDDLSLHAGGGAFITAATIATLGWETSILATLPAAPFDMVIRDAMQKFGIDNSLCVDSPQGAAPQITVATVMGGDRAFLTHQSGDPAPETNLAKGHFGHLHIGELSTLIEKPDLCERAHASGLTVSCDCGWDSDLIADGKALSDLISQVDVFLPNQSEFEGLMASGLNIARLPLTAIKLGSTGAKLWDGSTWISEPALNVTAVDTTGAGDAFNGGFLTQWLSGSDFQTCLKMANTCGAAAVQHVGGAQGLHKIATLSSMEKS